MGILLYHTPILTFLLFLNYINIFINLFVFAYMYVFIYTNVFIRIS